MKIGELKKACKIFVILLSGSVVVSCEDKTPGIPPAVSEISHTIGGIVSDARGGILKDVTVML